MSPASIFRIGPRRLPLLICLVVFAVTAIAQRRITPVNTAASATQPINELANDTARINARIRASMMHYRDENGNIVYVDTVTGREWRDSTVINAKKPMQYPLLHSVSVGVDLWNPLMRAFGQHYGLIDFSAGVSLHNRYKPLVEIGLGTASNTPEGNNFTYKSPLSVYFRIGAEYNFLYNATPDYQFTIGLRYGFAPFSWSVEDITIGNSYWGSDTHPTIPSQTATAGWMEFTAGIRVKLWGPFSAGWTFRVHSILHESNSEHGKPWYIPGYGSRKGAITGSFSIFYTLPLNKTPRSEVNTVKNQ